MNGVAICIEAYLLLLCNYRLFIQSLYLVQKYRL